jgi:hypothetical protein
MSKARRDLGKAYRVPLLLALASLFGLISALIGDGLFDLLSWIALGGLGGHRLCASQ